MPDLLRMLAAAGPYAGIDANRQLYTPLIGAWEVDATWYESDGSTRQAMGNGTSDGSWEAEVSRTWRLDQEMRGARP